MIISAKEGRELRRWLRAARDCALDVADAVGTTDREQQRRLQDIARDIEAEMADLDRKINAALAVR
jgi:hypothetical protein